MFKANQNTQFVATKVVSIKPEAQINYTAQVNQIRWLIPQYLGFVDPSTLYLKYNLTMSGRGHTRPDGRAGVHSLLRDCRIQDGTGRAELEMLQDYNVNTAQVWGYTSNRSIDHQRELFEGKSSNSDLDQQLFWGQQGDWTAGDVEDSPTAKNVQIQQPLYSGVLGPDSKVCPLVAFQGLRVQMTLDTIERSCITASSLMQGSANCTFLKTALLGATGATNADKWIKAAADDEFSFIVKGVVGGAATRVINRNASPNNNNPLFMDDIVYISLADDSAERELGVVVQLENDGANDCKITVIPNRATAGTGLTIDYPADSKLYFKQADRMKVQTYADVGATHAGPHPAVAYTISDLEMLVAQVQPPQSYIERMMSQIGSSAGLSMDYRTDSLYRFNLTALNGLTNQLIPAIQHRAYTILSVPLEQNGQGNIERSSFRGLTDGCQNYQYVFGGSLIPDRRVDLERYNNATPRTDALHIIELEKALVNANHPVRDLQRVPDRFLIGRGLSKYGQVFNLDSADLSLRVEYVGATEAKMFEHFVNHLRRVNISSQGVQVIV